MPQKSKSARKQRREAILALLEELVIEFQFMQKRPYTAVQLLLERTDAPPLFGTGFAKVCHPDVWDAEYGYNLATQKAMADLTRQLIAEHDRVCTVLALEATIREFCDLSVIPFDMGEQRIEVSEGG